MIARIVIVVSMMMVSLAFSQSCPYLFSVPDFDVKMYTGGWYEIGTSRIVYSTFERNCFCVKANYSLQTDNAGVYVEVNNQCRRGSISNPVETLIGRAVQNDPINAPGQLTVNFPGSPPADNPNYYIIDIGPNDKYQHVLVGEPCRRALWILSRTNSITNDTYNALLNVATVNGFNLDRIMFRRTVQNGC